MGIEPFKAQGGSQPFPTPRVAFRMRLQSFLWLLVGGACIIVSCREIVRLASSRQVAFDGAMVTTCLTSIFGILACAVAFGTFKSLRWSFWVAGICSSVLSLYCVCFLLMVGLRFGIVAFAACLGGLVIAGFTLFNVLRQSG
jgi:hypothetical protein